MKLLLTGINAKYVHTNLAIRYLYFTVSNFCDASIYECSINDNILSVERDIILAKPDILAFSCYIWNIDFVLQLCSDIKKANAHVIIILGGPEVSFDSFSLMTANSCIDYVVNGEGEDTFPRLISHICGNAPLPCCGITYRSEGNVYETPASEPPDFSTIPFPYENFIVEQVGKIIYYESSRGCPYSCKYCLSGDNTKVRFKDVSQVFRDLSFFDSKGVPLVKFVDRTFNSDRKRANMIWQHISSLPGDTRFHMEITGELLDDDALDVLKNVNPDKLQFEIGVQTTNVDTLKMINRSCNIDRLFNRIRQLLSETDIHIHLDLIVGLPHETFASFQKSFNDVLALKPHVLQIGFLKVLKGSAMHHECKVHGIKYCEKAPYEIISNNYMSAEEILFIKDLEFVFDKVYNSGSFSKSIDYLLERSHDAFDLFSVLVEYFRTHCLINSPMSKSSLFDVVFNCFSYMGDEFEHCLRFDYILALKPGKLPSWSKGDDGFRFSDEVYAFLKDEEAKKRYIPKYYNVPAKAAIKKLRFEQFGGRTLIFDYDDSKVYDVSEYYIPTKQRRQ